MELLNGVVKYLCTTTQNLCSKNCAPKLVSQNQHTKLEPQNLSLTLVNKTFVHFLESVFLH